ncbi:hypothetical protein [Pseudobacillus wudalianchiensis]|uniref:Uncharacterized protein n=1 Tax=Pseudobacillus wudalianchiensis TaxID=1743143 RepID=A0A1B9B8Z9_9BACI|nr:hypothetical protein [Bacillus wudalianchiensis]OCA92565.1 hypothetical protein A8F95_02385 [Bacillus wudalianchiensis]
MRKHCLLILGLLSLSLLLLISYQPKNEQSIQETDQHSVSQMATHVKKDISAAYNEEDVFKRTVSIGSKKIILPLHGLYLDEN